MWKIIHFDLIWFGTATIFFTYVLTYLQKLSGQTRNLGKTKSCEATKNKRDAWVNVISNSNEKKSVFELMDFWRVWKAKPLEFWWCHAEHYSLRAWLFVPTALVHNQANKFIKSHSNWPTRTFPRDFKYRNWCWILRNICLIFSVYKYSTSISIKLMTCQNDKMYKLKPGQNKKGQNNF